MEYDDDIEDFDDLDNNEDIEWVGGGPAKVISTSNKVKRSFYQAVKSQVMEPGFRPNIVYDASFHDFINCKYDVIGEDTTTSDIDLIPNQLFDPMWPYFVDAYLKVIANEEWKLIDTIEVNYDNRIGKSVPRNGLFVYQKEDIKVIVDIKYLASSDCVLLDLAYLPKDSEIVDNFTKQYVDKLYAIIEIRGKVLAQKNKSLYIAKTPDVKDGDLIIPDSIMSKLDSNITKFFGNIDKLEKYGIRRKRGILIYGPPGVGKTSILKSIAHKLVGDITFIVINVVESAKAFSFNSLFKVASLLSPTVLVIEDIDFLASRNEPLLCELLNVLDGFHEYKDIVTVATTNDIDALDEALSRRPGRFDVSVEFKVPTKEERKEALTLFFGKAELDTAHIDDLVKITDRYSYAHLQELTNQIVIASMIDGDETPIYKPEKLQDILKNLPAQQRSEKLGFRSKE